VRAVGDLESKGAEIQVLTPESILVHEETREVRILLSKSTIQTVSEAVSQQLVPSFDFLRQMPPEYLEGSTRAITGCSWSIGVMM
jgi:hypothetical protein